MPLVSVIILSYNRVAYLLEALESVLQQSYINFEILILDDGSSDNTRQEVEVLEHSKIQYFFFPHSGNIMRLRNEGVKRAKGKYIAFLDSDDLWLPAKLEKQVAFLESNPAKAMVFSDIEEFDQKGLRKKGIYKTSSNLFLSVLSGECPIYPSSTLIRKTAIDQIGQFDEASKTGETHYFLKLIQRFPIYLDLNVLTKIRKHATNITHHLEEEAYQEMLESMRYFWQEERLSNFDYKRLRNLYYFRFATLLLKKKQYRKALLIWYKGFKASLLGQKWMKLFIKIFIASGGAFLMKQLKVAFPTLWEKWSFIKSKRFYTQFLQKGDLCFDIGANEGLKTAMFLALEAKVIALEPQQNCCLKIRERFPNHANLSIVNKAVGSREGRIEMFISTYDKISSLSKQFVNHFESYGELEWPDKELVRVTTLDQLIEEYGIPQFCKIDVEGYEMEVFRGLSHALPSLSFEFNRPFKDNAVHCLEYLLKLGPYTFNYSTYENPYLELEDWVTGEEMAMILLNMDEKVLTGDVYARLRAKNTFEINP